MLTKSSRLTITLLLLLSAIAPLVVGAHGDEAKSNKSIFYVGIDSPAAQTVNAFHKALKRGDKLAARALLADNVIIFEGGGVERSADEYANHHMLADMKYLKAVESKQLEHQVYTHGDIAYSIARSATKGSYKGKDINTSGMETMTLKNSQNGWKITHIHWSN